MAASAGPKIVQNNLQFSFDASNFNSVGAAGAYTSEGGYTYMNNRFSGRTLVIQNATELYVAGKTYYTLYALTYPETSQTPASRDGITPGLNNTTAAKTYDLSRDLNYFAFDEDTNTWVADSYFTGERINGHCYDTLDGLSGDGVSSEHNKFQHDYDVIKANFPNATHIVIGSHAAENNDNDAQTLSRLQQIGLPDSHIGVGRPEYILVGKPNRPATWVYVRENISAAVAKLNLALPLEGVRGRGVYFAGTTNERIALSPALTLNSTSYTLEMWVKRSSTGRNDGIIGDLQFNWFGVYINTSNKVVFGHKHSTPSETRIETISSTSVGTDWTHIACTFTNGNGMRIYINGEIDQTDLSDTIAFSLTGSDRGFYYIGSYYASAPNTSDYSFLGEIALVNAYDAALTATEIKQNYNATKGRFV